MESLGLQPIATFPGELRYFARCYNSPSIRSKDLHGEESSSKRVKELIYRVRQQGVKSLFF